MLARVVVFAAVLCAICSIGGWAQTFTDITKESGVDQVVAKHYAASPDWWLSGLDLVDVDGDGDLDLRLASHRGAGPAGAYNDGTGHFTYVDPQFSLPRGPREPHNLPIPGNEVRMYYDFDEDGKVDWQVHWWDGAAQLWLNRSRPGEPAVWEFTPTHQLDLFSRACAVVDLNRDGKADWLQNAHEARAPVPEMLLALGNGDGTFAAPQVLGGSLGEAAGIPVDIDGDGDIDLLSSANGYRPSGRRVLLNDGRMGFSDVTSQVGLDEKGGSIHGAGDVDHDGDVDLICLEGPNPPTGMAIYLNDGRGMFHVKHNAISGVNSRLLRDTNWGGAVVTDFDNDGIADVIINGKYFLFLLRGTGGGSFEGANGVWGVPTTCFSAVSEGLCFGDIDADGDLDLVTMTSLGEKGDRKGVAVFRNDLPRRHWLRVRPVGGKGNRGAAGAKIRLYEAGGMGDPGRLLWYEQVAIWGRQSFHSYYAHSLTERHFGLGERDSVDVSVEFYPSGKRVEAGGLKADMTVELREL